MTQRGQMLVVALHAVIGLAVLGSATALALANHPVTIELATLYGAIIGLAGGGSAAVSALGTAVNGKTTIDPQLIRDILANNQSAVEHLAGARTIVDRMTETGGRRADDPEPITAPAA